MSTQADTAVKVPREYVTPGPWQNASTASWAVHIAFTGWVACSLADAQHHESQQRTVARITD